MPRTYAKRGEDESCMAQDAMVIDALIGIAVEGKIAKFDNLLLSA